jgi:hypothetical protein
MTKTSLNDSITPWCGHLRDGDTRNADDSAVFIVKIDIVGKTLLASALGIVFLVILKKYTRFFRASIFFNSYCL